MIRIEVDVGALARSRFAISPAFDVVATLRGRRSSTLPFARHWYERARARLDVWTIDLLEALVPADHHYVPDFLTPQPMQPRETRDRMVEGIAAAPADLVSAQLDHLFDGRAVQPQLAEAMGGEGNYRRKRSPVPVHLRELLAESGAVVAGEAAAAMGRFFDAGLAEDWPSVAAVLEADIGHRSDVTARHGAAAMLESFGPDLRWDGAELTYPSRFEVTIDWAGDGLLFVPCAAHVEPILFRIEPPHSPIVMYAARGTATLSGLPRLSERARHAGLGDLIGSTRRAILQHLDTPHTTSAIAHLDGHAVATVSYHLRVLRQAGLVTSRRSGRGVLYQRSALGDALLSGVLPGTSALGEDP